MERPYRVRRKGRAWLITLPPEVRRALAVTGKSSLYWHLWRRGEVVLSVRPERLAGRPEVTRLTRELMEAREEITALRGARESRDRAMFAEGYAQGRIKEHVALSDPFGPSATRQRRRKLRRVVEAAPPPEPTT